MSKYCQPENSWCQVMHIFLALFYIYFSFHFYWEWFSKELEFCFGVLFWGEVFLFFVLGGFLFFVFFKGALFSTM